jgi:hypothetical protein
MTAAQILDLDAQVLGEHIAGITAWLPLQTPPRRIVDIGSGTGAGTFALLDRFPEAHITAVDASAGHLQRFPRFLPDNAPEDRPGLEERCHQASDRLHAHHVPHRGADWRPMLAKAGFTVEGERTITVNIESSRDKAVGTYALSTLQRIRHGIADILTPEDLAALDRLLDTHSPHSILLREDLAVHTERIVWAARRTE